MKDEQPQIEKANKKKAANKIKKINETSNAKAPKSIRRKKLPLFSNYYNYTFLLFD